jgi:hypothetical protein
MEGRNLQEGGMETWVVYHNASTLEVLEYVIEDVLEGIRKEDILDALDASEKGCLVKGKTIIHFPHEFCLLGKAPDAIQKASIEGKAIETLQWIDLWRPTSTPR